MIPMTKILKFDGLRQDFWHLPVGRSKSINIDNAEDEKTFREITETQKSAEIGLLFEMSKTIFSSTQGKFQIYL